MARLDSLVDDGAKEVERANTLLLAS